MTQSRHLADIFEAVAKLCGYPKKTANWLMGEGLRILKEKGMEPEELTFTLRHLSDLILAVERGEINHGNARLVFEQILEADVEPAAYMEEHGMRVIMDDGALFTAVDEVLAENPKVVEEFHGGKEKVFGFLVGQVMKKMKGKADPGKVNEVLRGRL